MLFSSNWALQQRTCRSGSSTVTISFVFQQMSTRRIEKRRSRRLLCFAETSSVCSVSRSSTMWPFPPIGWDDDWSRHLRRVLIGENFKATIPLLTSSGCGLEWSLSYCVWSPQPSGILREGDCIQRPCNQRSRTRQAWIWKTGKRQLNEGQRNLWSLLPCSSAFVKRTGMCPHRRRSWLLLDVLVVFYMTDISTEREPENFDEKSITVYGLTTNPLACLIKLISCSLGQLSILHSLVFGMIP